MTAHLHRLIPPDSHDGRIVFDWQAPEHEAAKCTLAAALIQQDRLAEVTQHRYAFSLPVAVEPPTTAYVHYFQAPPLTLDGPAPLVPIRTVHTPGVDDLGGLIRIAP